MKWQGAVTPIDSVVTNGDHSRLMVSGQSRSKGCDQWSKHAQKYDPC